MSREAMEMALNALTAWDARGRLRVIEALRTALAQPEKIECSRSHPHENMGSHCQLRTEIARLTNENAHLKAQPEPEPVAWMHKFIDDVITKNRPTDITRNAGRWTALYTAPPQRKPLTDEQIEGVFFDMGQYAKVDLKAFARAIEAAHGIGDGPLIDEGTKGDEQEYCPHGKVEGRYCHDCGVIEQAEMRGEL